MHEESSIFSSMPSHGAELGWVQASRTPALEKPHLLRIKKKEKLAPAYK
jgi:hypothetical protein